MTTNSQNASLSDISSGNISINRNVFQEGFIVKKNKLSNLFLVEYIKVLKERGLSDKDILDLIVILDKGVESGEFNESNLFKL